jgi:hypothetical protein
MTPRERWETVRRGGRLDRLPCGYRRTGEVTSRLEQDLSCGSDRELWERLDVGRLSRLVLTRPWATESAGYLQSLLSVWHVGTQKTV